MSDLYKKGDYVVYGKMGVCRVVERDMMRFGSTASGEYYVLTPMSDPRSFVYVPCDNEQLIARLRPIFTEEEINTILRDVPMEELAWVEDKNERSLLFSRLIAEGDRRQLLRLVRCLYEKKQEKSDSGKKLSASDESILQECVRLVEEEFALSLNIQQKDVAGYIQRCINEACHDK